LITLVVVGALNVIYIMELTLPLPMGLLGLEPRRISGLWGLVFSPFIHLSPTHLMANCGALLVLLPLSLTLGRRLTVGAVLIVALLGGGLVWLFGRPHTIHFGASGVVFGLISFLVFYGIFSRRIIPLLISFIVLISYGWVALLGMVPAAGVSWGGHVFGFLSGIAAAYYYRDHQPRRMA
jgi:membrane associated rhomboid family serine protease